MPGPNSQLTSHSPFDIEMADFSSEFKLLMSRCCIFRGDSKAIAPCYSHTYFVSESNVGELFLLVSYLPNNREKQSRWQDIFSWLWDENYLSEFFDDSGYMAYLCSCLGGPEGGDYQNFLESLPDTQRQKATSALDFSKYIDNSILCKTLPPKSVFRGEVLSPVFLAEHIFELVSWFGWGLIQAFDVNRGNFEQICDVLPDFYRRCQDKGDDVVKRYFEPLREKIIDWLLANVSVLQDRLFQQVLKKLFKNMSGLQLTRNDISNVTEKFIERGLNSVSESEVALAVACWNCRLWAMGYNRNYVAEATEGKLSDRYDMMDLFLSAISKQVLLVCELILEGPFVERGVYLTKGKRVRVSQDDYIVNSLSLPDLEWLLDNVVNLPDNFKTKIVARAFFDEGSDVFSRLTNKNYSGVREILPLNDWLIVAASRDNEILIHRALELLSFEEQQSKNVMLCSLTRLIFQYRMVWLVESVIPHIVKSCHDLGLSVAPVLMGWLGLTVDFSELGYAGIIFSLSPEILATLSQQQVDDICQRLLMRQVQSGSCSLVVNFFEHSELSARAHWEACVNQFCAILISMGKWLTLEKMLKQKPEAFHQLSEANIQSIMAFRGKFPEGSQSTGEISENLQAMYFVVERVSASQRKIVSSSTFAGSFFYPQADVAKEGPAGVIVYNNPAFDSGKRVG